MDPDRLRDLLKNIRSRADELIARDPAPTGEDFIKSLVPALTESTDILAAIAFRSDGRGGPTHMASEGVRNITGGTQLNIDGEHLEALKGILKDGTVHCHEIDSTSGVGKLVVAAGPIIVSGNTVGVLEIFLGSTGSPDDRTSAVTILEAATELVSNYLYNRTADAQGPPPPAFWQRFERFVLDLQRTLDLDAVVYTGANDGRLLLGCDRLSIVLRHGPKAKLHAISGQDVIQHRANLVVSMKEIALRVMNLGETVTFSGNVDGFPEDFQKPLSEYLSESKSRMVMLVPFRENAKIKRTEEELRRGEKKVDVPIIGCLLIEQSTESLPRPTVRQRLDLVRDHIAAAISNSQQHEGLFMLPVWRALGRTWGWFRGRNLWIAAAVLAGCTVLGLALWLIPWEYRVEADGKLMPVSQRDVFAPEDGVVVAIPERIEGNTLVEAGELLLQLDNDDLREQLVAGRNIVTQKLKEESSLADQLNQANQTGQREDVLRLQGDLARTTAERIGANQRVTVLETRISHLTVKAPIKGVVATFQVKQNLLMRPVRRGESLLEVMDDSGAWRLELQVPEHRMGHMQRALAKASDSQLKIEWVPQTSPERAYTATLIEVATRSNEAEETGTVVEVFASVPEDQLPSRRIGTEVTAKINCGKMSLFYVLFGDVVEFLQKHLWL